MRYALPVLLVASLASAGPANAAPGEFDRSFADRGVFRPHTELAVASGSAAFVATDREGRVISGGRAGPSGSSDFYARTSAQGIPDTSLAGVGHVLGTGGGLETSIPLTIAPVDAGRSLIFRNIRTACFGPGAGVCAQTPGRYEIQRVEENGMPDTTYGEQGTVRPVMGSGLNLGFHRSAIAEPSGALLVFGHQYFPDSRLTFARFDSRGRRDAAFEANAQASMYCNGLGASTVRDGALLRLPGGRLLVAQAHALGPPDAPTSYPVCVRRLNADGTLDASYGTGGEATLDAAVFTSASNGLVALLPAPGGGAALVIEKFFRPPASARYFHVIAWLLPNGSLDTSRVDRGVSGPSDLHVSKVLAAAIQEDGRVLLAGYPGLPTSESEVGYDTAKPRIGRLRQAGGNDLSFGAGGQGFTTLEASGVLYHPSHIHVAPDGAIYVAASASGSINSGSRYAIVKLEGDTPAESNNGGGGGCGTIAAAIPPDPTLPALVLLSLALLLTRRRHVGR